MYVCVCVCVCVYVCVCVCVCEGTLGVNTITLGHGVVPSEGYPQVDLSALALSTLVVPRHSSTSLGCVTA